MHRRPLIPVRAWLGLVLVCLLLISSARSRAALERGNRLYRGGDARAAADIYSARIDTTAVGFRATYNLGTALIQLGSDQAERYLLSAIEGVDAAAEQRAHYNLAYRLLTGVEADTDPFSAVPLLAAAIDHNRAALRLDPEDTDAKWNLALAVQIYGGLPQVFEEGPADSGEGDVENPGEGSEGPPSEADDGEATDQSEDVPPMENPGTSQVIMVGAQETLATGDPGPLTEGMAMSLLEERTDDTEQLVRGILWSQRPILGASDDGRSLGGSW